MSQEHDENAKSAGTPADTLPGIQQSVSYSGMAPPAM